MATSDLKLEKSTSFTLAADIVFRKNHDGTVILMRMDDSDLFYKIDGVAAEVWCGLEGKKTMGEIVSDVLVKYNVDEGTVWEDASQLVSKLAQMKIISLVS